MVFPSYLVAITFTAHSPRSVEYHAQFSCTHSAENLLSLSASENGQISFVLFAQLQFSLHIVFLHPSFSRIVLWINSFSGAAFKTVSSTIHTTSPNVI